MTVVIPDAPASSSNPPILSLTDETAAGLEGFVMSIIWTPSSAYDATRAYVEAPIVTAAIPHAPASSSNPPSPSVTDAVAAGLEGSVTSIIWTPSSAYDATRAYVLAPIVTATMSAAPSSSSNLPIPSVADATVAGLKGSVTLIIWTLLSQYDATRA